MLTAAGPAALSGWAEMAPTPRRPKPFTCISCVEFDRPIEKFEGWVEKKLTTESVEEAKGKNAGALLDLRQERQAAVDEGGDFLCLHPRRRGRIWKKSFPTGTSIAW